MRSVVFVRLESRHGFTYAAVTTEGKKRGGDSTAAALNALPGGGIYVEWERGAGRDHHRHKFLPRRHYLAAEQLPLFPRI